MDLIISFSVYKRRSSINPCRVSGNYTWHSPPWSSFPFSW